MHTFILLTIDHCAFWFNARPCHYTLVRKQVGGVTVQQGDGFIGGTVPPKTRIDSGGVGGLGKCQRKLNIYHTTETFDFAALKWVY